MLGGKIRMLLVLFPPTAKYVSVKLSIGQVSLGQWTLDKQSQHHEQVQVQKENPPLKTSNTLQFEFLSFW